MRYIVYMVAVLAAAGIVYYVGTTESGAVASRETAATQAATQDLAADAADAGSLHTVNLKVPGMHCPAACYPSVKKTLEEEAGVQGVDLVEQKEEGLIDNPVVIIQHDAGFDLDKAVASLERVGFSGAAITAE